MKNTLVAALAAAAIIVVLNAQDTAPVPYVASVKKNAGGFGAQMRIAPGMISANGVPVRLLMRQAFGQLQDFQLIGGPDWISSDRFDIEAKIEGGAPMTPQVLQSVIRQILEERFALKTHSGETSPPFHCPMLSLGLLVFESMWPPASCTAAGSCASISGNFAASNVWSPRSPSPSHWAPKPSNKARARGSSSIRFTCPRSTLGSWSVPASAKDASSASGIVDQRK